MYTRLYNVFRSNYGKPLKKQAKTTFGNHEQYFMFMQYTCKA